MARRKTEEGITGISDSRAPGFEADIRGIPAGWKKGATVTLWIRGPNYQTESETFRLSENTWSANTARSYAVTMLVQAHNRAKRGESYFPPDPHRSHWKTGDRVKLTMRVRLHPAGLPYIDLDEGETGTVTLGRDTDAAVQFDNRLSLPPQYIHSAWLKLLPKKNPKARDPAHRKLLRQLDSHFAMDEKAGRKKNARKRAKLKLGKKMRAVGGKSALKYVPNPDAFVIVARVAGKRLTFDANTRRFSDNSKPSLYATPDAAQRRGLELVKKYPLLSKYRITVEKAIGKETGAVFGARPRRKNPTAKGGPIWEYETSAGKIVRGHIEKVSDKGGTDVTYFMRRESGELDVLSGARLKKSKVLRNPKK